MNVVPSITYSHLNTFWDRTVYTLSNKYSSRETVRRNFRYVKFQSCCAAGIVTNKLLTYNASSSSSSHHQGRL